MTKGEAPKSKVPKTKVSKTEPTDSERPMASLVALRDEIDRIDRELHDRLIERGEIIDRLIAVKAGQSGTSAFRPAREADMMRRLVTRHKGILPLATVESIWRIIISTFTYVQAPYTVHVDLSGDGLRDTLRMHDSARFHFGFTVPLATHRGAEAVIAAVADASGDLGLVHADAAATPWWQALMASDAPKIIARLPFVERADHAAGLPLFIVAKPLADDAPRDVLLYAVEPVAGSRLARHAEIEVLATCGGAQIVAVPTSISADSLAAAYRTDGQTPRVAFIGSHAARFEVGPAPMMAST